MAREKKKRKRSAVGAATESEVTVAVAAGPPWLRPLLAAVAILYLGATFLNGAARRVPLPATLRYFVQTTCLFPQAATATIDYRLEGWDCSASRFIELDPRPYFPVNAGDKESRFYRVAQFHRQNRPVMQTLERYVIAQENARSGRRIGGIRVSSLRLPIPPLGATRTRWAPRALADYPKDEKKGWYFTPISRRASLCGAPIRSSGGDEKDEPAAPKKVDEPKEDEP